MRFWHHRLCRRAVGSPVDHYRHLTRRARTGAPAALGRHADFEVLYDRPYTNNGVVRVSGPFTVESLSPHRSLAFAGGARGPETATESAAARSASRAASLMNDGLTVPYWG